MKRTFSASSLDANLPLRYEGEVHSVFSKVLNIRTEENELISIVATEKLNGPHRVLLKLSEDEDFVALEIREGMGVRGNRQEVKINRGRLSVSLEKAERWSPEIKRGGSTPYSQIKDNLSSLKRSLLIERDGDRISQALRTRTQELIASIKERNLPKVSENIKRLIGFGKGLTPSGDDFLVGLIASLHFLGNSTFADSPSIVNRLRLRGSFRQSSIVVRNKTQPYYVRRNELRNPSTYAEKQKKCKSPVGNLEAKHLLKEIKRVIHLEKEKTTFLSGKFLEYACQDRFPETILYLIEAIFSGSREGTEEAARRCLDFGATSGRDTLLGIVGGLDLIVNSR